MRREQVLRLARDLRRKHGVRHVRRVSAERAAVCAALKGGGEQWREREAPRGERTERKGSRRALERGRWWSRVRLAPVVRRSFSRSFARCSVSHRSFSRSFARCSVVRRSFSRSFARCSVVRSVIRRSFSRSFARCPVSHRSFSRSFARCSVSHRSFSRSFARCPVSHRSFSRSFARCAVVRRSFSRSFARCAVVRSFSRALARSLALPREAVARRRESHLHEPRVGAAERDRHGRRGPAEQLRRAG